MTLMIRNFPRPFRVTGMLTAIGGPFGAPAGGHGDGNMCMQSGKIGLYFSTNNPAEGGGGISYIEKAYSKNDKVHFWPQSPLVGGNPHLQLPPIPASPSASAVDTNYYVWNPRLRKHFQYTSSRPGTKPAGPPVGAIRCVQAASSFDTNPVTRTWTRHPDLVIQAQEPWEQGFINPGGEWEGGCDEISVIWDDEDQKMIAFHSGFSWPGGAGPFQWVLGRSVEIAPFDGLHFERSPTDFVYNPKTIPEGQFGSGFGGAYHFHCFKGPKSGVYYCLYLHGNIGGAPATYGVCMAISFDKGITWKPYAHNPLFTRAKIAADTGLATPTQLNAPYHLVDDGLDKIYIGCAGGPNGAYQINSGFYLGEAPWL
jgi:hypothetical protein